MYTIKRLPEFDQWLNSIKTCDVGRANRTMKKQTTSKKIKAADLPVFDVADYLDSQEAIAEYLTAMIESGDASMVAVALGDVARAKGMAEVAKASGLTREALYKALRADAQPRFDTVNRVCQALGVKLVALPQ